MDNFDLVDWVTIEKCARNQELSTFVFEGCDARRNLGGSLSLDLNLKRDWFVLFDAFCYGQCWHSQAGQGLREEFHGVLLAISVE